MRIVLDTAIFATIYIVLAVSFDLVLGYAKLFSVAHAAFFAVGAYGVGILSGKHDVPLIWSTVAGMLAAALLSTVIAALAIRVASDYLVIASFGFQIVVIVSITNFGQLTGGTLGIGNIPAPSFFGSELTDLGGYVGLYAVIAGLVVLGTWWLARSPFGRVLHSIGENEVAAQALGKRTVIAKVWTLAIAGGLAALAGAMYACYVSYISPDSFGNTVNILVIAMVIIGGAGTILGPVIGAILLAALPPALALFPLSPSLLGPLEQIIYGCLLIVFVASKADGIFALLRNGYSAVARLVSARSAPSVPESTKAKAKAKA